jgi:hypothetical protein
LSEEESSESSREEDMADVKELFVNGDGDGDGTRERESGTSSTTNGEVEESLVEDGPGDGE